MADKFVCMVIIRRNAGKFNVELFRQGGREASMTSVLGPKMRHWAMREYVSFGKA
jgi:hypothetical protein